ncbi:hypothetical protein PQX77_003034 [Marasmius sp. AFHP31]|nr:hypothetical protein PQX77_003034 [Marasmius sp. AFHP31]
MEIVYPPLLPVLQRFLAFSRSASPYGSEARRGKKFKKSGAWDAFYNEMGKRQPSPDNDTFMKEYERVLEQRFPPNSDQEVRFPFLRLGGRIPLGVPLSDDAGYAS